MMSPGILGDVLQMLRPGQRLQHLDRHLDVVIDDLPLLLRQRAGANCQIDDFVRGQEIRFIAVDVMPVVRLRYVAHPLLVLRAHRLGSEIAEA